MPFPQPQQLPKAPQTMGRRAEKTAREPFQEPLLLLLPSVSAPPSLLPREPPKTGIGGVEVGQGFGRADGTFWIPNQQHQPLPGGIKAVPIVGCDLGQGGGGRKEG